MLNKTRLALAAAASLCVAQSANAALFSTTKVEALYGWNYEDQAGAGFPIDNEEHAILTLASATGWTYGDSFFFADVTNLDHGSEGENDFGSVHAEWNLRGNIGELTGRDLSAGPVSDLYVTGQLDIDRNSSVRKTIHMAGCPPTWRSRLPVLQALRHVSQRREQCRPRQFRAVHGSLEPALHTGRRGLHLRGVRRLHHRGRRPGSQLLTQPQLVWHATEHLGIGMEYQHWENKFGLADTDESFPQAMIRWTF